MGKTYRYDEEQFGEDYENFKRFKKDKKQKEKEEEQDEVIRDD
jgi:hypothetical protein